MTREQNEYKQEKENYLLALTNWSLRKILAESCPYQISDGKGEPDSLRCSRNNIFIEDCPPCTKCNYKLFNEPRPRAPEYKRVISPIPTYCINCIKKKECKNIQDNIEWCLFKEEGKIA